MTNRITATVSKKKLVLIPDITSDLIDVADTKDNEFDVVVINESDKFASFQLELLAPGLDSDAELEWYRVEPEVCAKKPPGAETKFHVVVKKPPIPAYETTIDLTLRVFSVEYAHLFTSQTLRLTIEKPRKPLRVYLPTKTLKGFPGDEIEIPVLVYNLSPNLAEVSLYCAELNPAWLPNGAAQTLTLEPGDSEKTHFLCRLPNHCSTLSQSYPLTIEARSHTGHYSTREQGILNVLPQGKVEFGCPSTRQTIPAKREWHHHPQGVATYGLEFTNASNLAQRVNVQVVDGDQDLGDRTIPSSIDLQPGESQQAVLVMQRNRPWLGWKRRLTFAVTPCLSDPQTGNPSETIQPQPNTKNLELDLLPLIAPWLQVGSSLLVLLLLWLLWLFRPIGHQSTVNFVRFSGDGTTVLSGSNDQTILRWFTNDVVWQPDQLLRLNFNTFRLNAPENIGDKIGKAVRVARHGEKNNLVAVGLEDGTIQLWDVAFTKPQKTLYQGTDRVFDLAFTKDSHYLFSAHGSGTVRLWNLLPENSTSKQNTRPLQTAIAETYPSETPKRAYFLFSVAAIAVSEKPQLVVVAGQYNKLALWDWKQNQVYEVPYRWQHIPDHFNQPVVSRYQSLTSVAINQRLLATADNRGYITLWDLSQRRCQSGVCNLPLLDQWRDGHGAKPVRSLALTTDSCYLASTGDDGRVMLWSLQQGRRMTTANAGRLLAHYPTRLNSVDITQKDNTLLVTSDADQDRVMLYRIYEDETHARCQ
jgi:WD40 repeat protein